jgi:hypothetical protein
VQLRLLTVRNAQPQADDSIYKVFVDPSGNHIIVSLQNGANYYVGPKMSSARVCSP